MQTVFFNSQRITPIFFNSWRMKPVFFNGQESSRFSTIVAEWSWFWSTVNAWGRFYSTVDEWSRFLSRVNEWSWFYFTVDRRMKQVFFSISWIKQIFLNSMKPVFLNGPWRKPVCKSQRMKLAITSTPARRLAPSHLRAASILFRNGFKNKIMIFAVGCEIICFVMELYKKHWFSYMVSKNIVF